MKNFNGEFANEAEDWNKLSMQEKEKIYKEDVEQLRRDFNSIEGGNEQAISDWTRKYGRRGYKNGIDGVINIPARDIIRERPVKQYSFEENDFNERKQTRNPNYNPQKVSQPTNNLSMNDNSQSNIVNRQQTEQNQGKSVNNDLSKIPQDIFADVPVGPTKKEILIKSNIDGAKRLKNMPFLDSPEKFWTFYKFVQSNGIWDYKMYNADTKKYEDFGNFHYGVVGTAAGFKEQTLLRAAGWVQRKDNKYVPKEYGYWFDIRKPNSSYGDDPKDQQQIKNGIDWYNRNKDFFE